MTDPGRARNGSAELTGANSRYSDNLREVAAMESRH